MRNLALLVFLFFLIAACAPQDEAAAPTTPAATTATATPEAAREAIQQLRQQWINGAERDDAAAVAALYTDDAIVTSPDGQAVRGRQDIQRLWETQFPMASNLRVEASKIEAGSDVVGEYGTFSQQINPPDGTAQNVNGEYVVVAKRQNDGSWRIAIHMSFPRTQAAAPPATATTTTDTTQ